MKLNLEQLNALEATEFERIFHNVIECWPQASAHIFAASMPTKSFATFLGEFDTYLSTTIDGLAKERILQYHPDLAGKLAGEGKLTTESTAEQASAGLNELDDEKRGTLQALNQQYKDKFGFPFVICVRQTNKFDAILAGMRERLQNSRDVELSTGIEEVKKICRLRICQIIDFVEK